MPFPGVEGMRKVFEEGVAFSGFCQPGADRADFRFRAFGLRRSYRVADELCAETRAYDGLARGDIFADQPLLGG